MSVKPDPVINTSGKVIPVARPTLGKEDAEAAAEEVRNNRVALGPKVAEFERDFARAHNFFYASSCNSGTSALILALAALGIRRGDTVLVPAFSMVALSNAVLVRGAFPFYCDSDPESYVGNVNIETIEKAISVNGPPNAIIVQHTYGVPVNDMPLIYELCKDKGISLIEDCAECLGTTEVGKHGDLSVFSFYGNKIITTGEGGMVCSNKRSLIDAVNSLKAHAFSHERHFNHTAHAYGMRCPNVNCAIGVEQLKKINYFISRRNDLINHYRINIKMHKINVKQSFPKFASPWVMPILFETEERRDRVREVLAYYGVETRTYFNGMNNQQFLGDYVSGDFPVSDNLSKCGLYLPLYPSLTTQEADYISTIVNKVIDSGN